MRSSDIDNWISEAKESTAAFLKDHVEELLISIRDDLFETFRKRQKDVMELKEVQSTADSLRQYEEGLMNPIRNLTGGELARALLIQVQKLNLDIEMAMLELDQILRANEINFAVLAALPALCLSFGLIYLVRVWFTQVEEAQAMFGFVLYSLDCLYKAVEKHAMETGEWPSLKQDSLDSGNCKLSSDHKLTITSRMERVYDCLLPSTKRR